MGRYRLIKRQYLFVLAIELERRFVVQNLSALHYQSPVRGVSFYSGSYNAHILDILIVEIFLIFNVAKFFSDLT